MTGRRRVAPFGVQFLSGTRVTIEGMELTGRDLDRIPARNLRVPVVEFARVWVAAERQYDQDKTWATYGVAATCRWLAGATVPNLQRTGREPARAPVTRRTATAYQELIATECLAAEKLLYRRPIPTWLANQPGWLPAVVATLAWAWQRSGRPPIEVPAELRG